MSYIINCPINFKRLKTRHPDGGLICFLVLFVVAFAACKSSTTTYVNHTEGRYSIADDTLIMQNTIIINRTGYQKIRNGQLQPKEYKVKQWGQHSPDAPIIRVDGKHAFLNNTIYTQVP